MNILFVHQGFPGQYRYIIRALAQQGVHRLVALGIEPLAEELPKGIQYIRYSLKRGNAVDVHPLAAETEAKVIRGEACATAAAQLRNSGFIPDLICCHPGWGESLFLKDIWPTSPMICYQEFYYQAFNSDHDFDLEIQGKPDWLELSRLRMKTANTLLHLNLADWNITPTRFQLSTFPSGLASRFSVIHDGVDLSLIDSITPSSVKLSTGLCLNPGDEVITFVNRRVEPYRGCHTLIRAIPLIQQLCPNAHLVIIGDLDGASYGRPPASGRWCDIFLKEISGQYDPSRVHFTGTLGYQAYLSLMRISKCHIYLTYPFVLSWSLMEAMAFGLPIVGSSTAPVKELITHGKTGLLVDFFDSSALADSVHEIISDPKFADSLGSSAKQLIRSKYTIEQCVPLHLNLMNLVASGSI